MVWITFTNTINLGAILLGIVVGFAGLATYGYGIRWKSNYEVEKARADSLEEGRSAFHLRATRFEEQLRNEMSEKSSLEAELAAEKVKTDMSAVLQKMDSGYTAILERLADTQTSSMAEAAKLLEAMESRLAAQNAGLVQALQKVDERMSAQTEVLRRVAERVVNGG